MSNPNVQPVAQDFVVAAKVTAPELFFLRNPNLTRLDDGGLLLAVPQWPLRGSDAKPSLRIIRSVDHGTTWQELPTLLFEEGTPFAIDGQLLMFVQQTSHKGFQVVSSDNQGETWSAPRTVLEGPLFNNSTSMVALPDAVFWAVDYDAEDERHHGKVMLRLDRGKDPLYPDAWSMSNIVPRPELPDSLTRGLFPPGSSPQIASSSKEEFTWLEPNTVEVGGRIRVFTRCGIDDQATAHTAGVLDYNPHNNRLSFTQFASWPGGQCKFFVVHDQPNRMYWMLSNLVTNSQDLLGWGGRMRVTGFSGGPGNERRWLFLHYSIDCLNWFPAGCVARWPDSIHMSFMYPSAVIDGDDLVVMSRTSRDSKNQHDADLCTVHRVRDFRNLAMDLHGGGLHD
jgi:hypothetical protein